MRRAALGALTILLLGPVLLRGQQAVPTEAAKASDVIDVKFDAARGGLTRLARQAEGAFNFMLDGQLLGEVETRVRRADGTWRENSAAASADVREALLAPDGRSLEVRYVRPSAQATGVRDLKIVEKFQKLAAAVEWTIRLENPGPQPLEVGDVALPLRMNTAFTWNKEETFNTRVYRHQFISGHGSFLFWQPVGGYGPHLVMVPLAGSKLEFFTETASDYATGGGRFTAFVHSGATGPALPGTWRQPHTSLTLAPGQTVTYGFAFHLAEDLPGVRAILYQQGGVDVRVAPGMVVPLDLEAQVALRTRLPVARIEAEFPAQTTVEKFERAAGLAAGTGAAGNPDTHLYRVRFSRLGENRLTVHYGNDQVLHLEFFVTEPLETLIKKRAAFIAARQQHRDPGKWFDGLFSLWDARLPAGKNLLGPENPAGEPLYAVSGSDDPSNSKCLYLSEKNAAWPEAREVASLEYFIEHFVWGKHQRTDREQPYPYGIYGADSWQINRFADRDPLEKGISRPGGPSACRMWRTFDYSTYFALYYNMYRIARQDPALVKYLDANGYLERAYGTARAFFEVPSQIRMEGGWSFTGWVYWAYTVGNFHEKYLLGIIDALDREGRHEKAAYLRREWEKKVKYFIYDDRYPWASEMPVDSTAFESTWAIARYAQTHPLQPDEKLWQDRNSGRWFSHPTIDAGRQREFGERQLRANLACRGTIEPAYYALGSDFRGCGQGFYALSYMSQMGGWSILDQALAGAPAAPGAQTRPAGREERFEMLRLGYASLLSSWALVNTGTPESHYGFWRPGELHDGAAGWGFTTQKSADEWCPAMRGNPRGAWPVDGEIDHGLAAGVEAACTVVADDPLFGLMAYGGQVRTAGGTLEVVPHDGVRQRLFGVLANSTWQVTLERDGFAAGQAVVLPMQPDGAPAGLRFVLESRTAGRHVTRLTLGGLAPGRYHLLVDGRPQAELQQTGSAEMHIDLPASGQPAQSVELRHIEQ